VIGDKF
jgi:hypothetical protein